MKDIRIICTVLEIYKKIKYSDFQAMTMSKIVNLCFEHLTFGWFQLGTMFPKSVKNYMHPLQVLFLHSGENYYII